MLKSRAVCEEMFTEGDSSVSALQQSEVKLFHYSVDSDVGYLVEMCFPDTKDDILLLLHPLT